jgi:hypothetical protein
VSIDAQLAKLDAISGAVSLPFDGKSLEVESDGTLMLRGILATTGVDRTGEQFDAPSLLAAFQRYYETNPVVCFNHRLTRAIGRLVDATVKPGGAIEVEAEIPKPPEGDPSETVYNSIRRGVLRAFSIGGRWLKVPMENGVTKLFTTEVAESSVCAGLGANAEALFEVVGVKSLNGYSGMDAGLDRLAALTAGPSSLDAALDRLGAL